MPRVAETLLWITLTAAASSAACDAAGAKRGADSRPRPSTTTTVEVSELAPSPTLPLSGSAPAGQERDGRQLYLKYCALCHGKSAEGYAADDAPSLVSPQFLSTATDTFIRRSINVGRPDTAMAGYAKSRGGPLEPADVKKLIAYLRAMGPPLRPLPPWTPAGNAAQGSRLYQRECLRCHGTSQQKAKAPWLLNREFLAAASPQFIRHAIEKGRPPTAMSAFEGRLSEQNIEDIVTWLKASAPRPPTPRKIQQSTVPDNLPLVINPAGKAPHFKLRAGKFVSAVQVKRALEQGQRLTLIDARSPSDWIQFRIPGAVPIAYYQTEKLSRIPKDGTWVVAYCACPHHASGQVVSALRKQGYKNTAILDEGILHWKQHGYPLTGETVSD